MKTLLYILGGMLILSAVLIKAAWRDDPLSWLVCVILAICGGALFRANRA